MSYFDTQKRRAELAEIEASLRPPVPTPEELRLARLRENAKRIQEQKEHIEKRLKKATPEERDEIDRRIALTTRYSRAEIDRGAAQAKLLIQIRDEQRGLILGEEHYR